MSGVNILDDLLPLVSTLAYPVDLEEPLSDFEPAISFLSDLAAETVVGNFQMLKSVLEMDLLPKSLYPTLLRACLLWGHDRSLRYLVRHWPFTCIRLRQLLTLPLLRSPLAIVYYECALSRLKMGIRLTTAIVRALIDCLADMESKTLELIDLSGFPTAEVVACFAAVQCQLANTDVQRQEMVKSFNEIVTMMRESKNELQTVNEFECVDEKFKQPCALVFDLTLSHGSRVDDIMHALVWSRTPSCRFRLIMSSLNLQGLGFDVITRILECTIKEELEKLDVAFNALGNQGVVLVAQLNSNFLNLTTLDLTSNNINLSSVQSRCESALFIGQSLASLPRLKHLSLSKNRLSSSLAFILGPITNELETLRLASCTLKEKDLEFLSKTNHGLKYLDLSENNLGDGNCWPHVITILKSRGSKLYLLELSRTFIGDEELGEIIKLGGASTWLRNIRYLNLSRNIIITRFLRQFLSTFTFEAPRCVLHLPCPFDCREREEPGEPDEHGLPADPVDHDLIAHGALKRLATRNVRIFFSGQAF